MNGSMKRRDFLRGILRPFSQADEENSQPDEMLGERTPNYRAMLPPEFSPSMLRMEAERLGCDTESMSEEDMAERVYSAMCGMGSRP
ncbi:MAG: apoptosis regulator Bcl-2 [Desulfovibrionaceae bacterium]|nr:apoptosis regulator Bcl-2 [Desulfovibrionaceae bacterium]